jgi:hypothetical protein
MKKLLFLLTLFCTANILHAQAPQPPYVYTIKADSVKITNSCDTAELIIENHTQNVPGFLFNKGKGRTEFRRAVRLNDSTLVVGGDTLIIQGHMMAKNGLSIGGKDAELGQTINAAGDPARLFNDREIPLNGHNLSFSGTGNIGIGTKNPTSKFQINPPGMNFSLDHNQAYFGDTTQSYTFSFADRWATSGPPSAQIVVGRWGGNFTFLGSPGSRIGIITVQNNQQHPLEPMTDIGLISTFNRSSGPNDYTGLYIHPSITQTGTSTVDTRGIWIDPTLNTTTWKSIMISNNTGWGLYADGTAPHYLNGNLLIGTTTGTGEKLQVNGSVLINDILKMPNILPKSDTSNYKPMAVDAGGNVFKMNGWPASPAAGLSVVNAGVTDVTVAPGTLVKLQDLAGAGSHSVILPSAANYSGQRIYLWNINSSSNSWNFSSSITLPNGTTSTSIANQSTIELISDGTVWLKWN